MKVTETLRKWWKNYTSSGIETLDANPFTQEAFEVRFINILCLLFTVVVFFVLIVDTHNFTREQLSNIPYFLSSVFFDLVMIALFISMIFLLRKTRNLSLVTSIFLIIVTFGGITFLIYFSEKSAENLIFVLCVPFIIFLLKGSKRGLWWWIAFTILVYSLVYLKHLSISFQFMLIYFEIPLIIYFYQRVNEKYEKLAEMNQVKLLQYLKEEEELIESKEIFMNIAAHKLRTPITIIRGMVERLKKAKGVTDDVKQATEALDRGSSRLITMVNELLSVLTIEKGNLELTKKNVNIPNLVKIVLREFEELAKTKKVSIKVIVDDPQIPKLNVDENYFTSILSNLISNAIQYNEQGGTVHIKISRDSSRMHISIKNTGVEISKAEKGKIFSKFYRSE